MLDFKDNPNRIFAAHELAAIVDSAMATKMTVQFNLFGKDLLSVLYTAALPMVYINELVTSRRYSSEAWHGEAP